MTRTTFPEMVEVRTFTRNGQTWHEYAARSALTATERQHLLARRSVAAATTTTATAGTLVANVSRGAPVVDECHSRLVRVLGIGGSR